MASARVALPAIDCPKVCDCTSATLGEIGGGDWLRYAGKLRVGAMRPSSLL